MDLIKAKIKNIGPFNDVEIDFTTLPDGLIAVIGDNGVGKTTFLECISIVQLFRQFAYYERTSSKTSKTGVWLADHCTSDDAMLDVEFVHNGHKFQTKNLKSESYLYKDGECLNPSGRVREFDNLVQQNITTRDVVLATQFSVQGDRGGFFDLDLKDRKKLFYQLLRLTELDCEIIELKDKIKELRKEYEDLSTKKSLVEEKRQQFNDALDIINTYSPLIVQKKELLKIYKSELGRANETLELDVKNELELGRQQEIIKNLTNLVDCSVDELRQEIDGNIQRLGNLNRRIAILEKLTSFPVLVSPIESIRSKIVKLRQFNDTLKDIDIHHPMCRACPLTKNAHGASIDIQILEEDILVEESVASWRKPQRDYTNLLNELRLQKDETIGLININMTKEEYISSTGGIEDQINFAKKKIDNIPILPAQEKTELSRCIKQKREQIEGLIEEIRALEVELGVAKREFETRELTDEDMAIEDRITKLGNRLLAGELLEQFLSYIIASKIEYALPEIENTANELIKNLEDGRFALELPFFSKKKNSDEEKEDFRPLIFDSSIGKRIAGSGGQRAMIGEALRTSICIFNSNVHNYHFKNLFRDEVTGSLSPNNASLYLSVLRNSMKLARFTKIFFVSHHKHVYEMADARIELKNGNIDKIY